MSAMTAAELNFPNPPAGEPQWLELAQAVFNTQASPDRYDGTCGGGLRWQIPPTNLGYDYKNTISNGCFFNMGARLAAYTGNASYAHYAERAWNWTTGVGYIDKDYNVFDGGHIEHNCTDINPVQFSYNHGVFLLGAATMYNFTNGSEIWRERVDGLLNHTLSYYFSRNNIAYEAPCEGKLNCTPDMFSFKAYLTRWMAASIKVAPFVSERVMTALRASAAAAALQCSGGSTGRACGLSWVKGAAWDGTQGVGQQMAAMEVIQSNLIHEVHAPFTASTGGSSPGNPSAGSVTVYNPALDHPPTKGGRIGAGFLTAFVLGGFTGLMCWISF
jgi:mannan endo-1,6-alpha-mannosidase